MAGSSNDGIMTEYMIGYGALRFGGNDRPGALLETLYVSDCYRAGQDLQACRRAYDPAIWNDVPAAQIEARLEELSRFMGALARDRASSWGVQL